MSDAVNHVVFAAADGWIKPRVMLEMPHVRRHVRSYIGGVLEAESKALFQRARPAEAAMMWGVCVNSPLCEP